MQSKLIAFAMDFTSFLIQKLKDKSAVRNIILFGSTARGEAEKESDVDIFIDVVKESSKLEEEIKKILENYYVSAKYKNYWKALGMENELNLTIGKLSRWKELESSIVSNGLLLFGKFKPIIKDGRHEVFFVWENVKPNSQRVLFNKQLFGYKQGEKFYQGLMQKFGGEKLGKGCIVVPLEHARIFQDLFKKYRLNVKMKKGLFY
ncbi:nucleotidyltransferase domain-containing protein [Candidatus Pacearchaeota archaeon]|nr:nucleotidyltransferase domain-containing protein [Candidatus Pacearchaeota archaeon]